MMNASEAPAKDEQMNEDKGNSCTNIDIIQIYRGISKGEVFQRSPSIHYYKRGTGTKSKKYQKHFVSHISRVICAMLFL